MRMGLQSVDTHLVVALHALLQERSVTRAARRVGVTQPSMSHALGRLRAHFHDALLLKVGVAMTLTDRARELVEPTAQAIERLERVFAPAARFEARSSERTFQLVATDNLELLVLPSLARLLAAKAPRIGVRCRNIPPDWPELLRKGEIDGKLGRGGPVPKDCRATLLGRETFVCLMRRGHRCEKGRLSAETYAACDHLVVSPHGEAGSLVDRALHERGLQRRVAMTVSHFLVAPFVVARSDLLLTVSARVADTLAERLDLVVRPCPVPLASYALTLVWPARLEADEAHRFFRGALQKAARRSSNEGA